MIDRRQLIVCSGAWLIPASARAQSPPRTARIGWLSQGTAPPSGTPYPPKTIFVERMRELGWVEGRNLVIEFRFAGGAEALPKMAAELVALRPGLIVAPGTTAIRAARDATLSIPIVMAAGGDPVGSGLVASLARPGGNITGVSALGQELIPKALSLLHEIVPHARRIDLLGNAAKPANPYFAKVFTQALRERGIEGGLVEARSADEMDELIASTRADALQMLSDPLLFRNAHRFADTAIRRRLPLSTSAAELLPVAAGLLMSYATAQDELWRLSADFADRILRGAHPAEMPIEQPSRFELFLNLKTAKALGIALPQSLRLRAGEVIE
ncbi:MAG: ABC transporter substrate-binding protein [Rubrivivax sp.]